MEDKITYAEIMAVRLLMRAGEIPITTEPINYHKQADKIILLTEEIKAERMTASMFD